MQFRRELLQGLKCLVITRRIIKKHVRLRTLKVQKPIIRNGKVFVSPENVLIDPIARSQYDRYFDRETGKKLSWISSQNGSQAYYYEATSRISGPRKKYVGLCPFHQEKTPSFFLYYEHRYEGWRYKCLGCGAHGDVIRFVQKLRSVDFSEAVNFILDCLGSTRSCSYRSKDPNQLRLFDENLEPL